MNRPARNLVILGSVLVTLYCPTCLWAGSLKSKIQQKLDNPSNIQYEPYYLQTLSPTTQYEPLPQTRGQTLAQEAAQNQRRVSPAQSVVSPYPGMREENLAASVLSSYVIYNMSYTAALEENVVTVQGHIVFEVFRKNGWTQIPLVDSSVGLIDVKVNKGSSFVTRQGDRYFLIINKPGRYNLDLEYLVKAQREREHGPGSFSVEVMPAPISQFEFTIPEDEVQIFVEPAIKVELKQEPSLTTAWAVMPNTGRINVRWTKALPKEEIVSVKLDPKVYVETATQASVGGGVISCRSLLNYSILQAEVSALRVALPADVSVLDVKGRELRDWKVLTKDDQQVLDVFLNFGTKGNYQLEVAYERSVPEGSGIVPMPWIKALGVERENGFYGIAATTNVELAARDLDRVTAIDTKQLPPTIWNRSANPILLAFKYLNPPISINIEITRHEELPVLIAAIDSASHVTLQTRDGKVLTKSTYYVRNNVKQYLRLDLPPQAKIWSSFVAGKPVKPARDQQGHIMIPLEKSQWRGEDLTQFPVEIVYLDKGTQLKGLGRINLNLAKTDVPINEIRWSVYLPEDFDYFHFTGDVRWDGDLDGPAPWFLPQRYLQRGLQGRIRDASSYLAAQGSVGGAAAVQELARAFGQGPSAQGVLPIRISVPEQGKLYHFSKLLVTEGEATGLSMFYTGVLARLRKPARVLVFVFAGALVFLRLKRRRRRKEQAPAAS